MLVNCAGITCPGVFTELDPNKFTVSELRGYPLCIHQNLLRVHLMIQSIPFPPQELYKVNVLGSVQPTRALLPSMIQRQWGRVAFVSSQAGQVMIM